MRILILGASGFVGRALRQKLSAEYDVYGTYCRQNAAYDADPRLFRFDAADEVTFSKILQKVQPQTVISCMRGDFGCQLRIHKQLAEFLQSREGSRLLYFSTANVFDNSLAAPHYEADKPDAESDYGIFKAQCEALLYGVLGEHCLILRIPEVWGVGCPRLDYMQKAAQEKQKLHVYENVLINYTLNTQIADCVQEILQKDLRGIFHIGTKDMCSHAEFRRKIAQRLHISLTYNVEYSAKTTYQALLTTRSDLQAAQNLTIETLLKSLFQTD